MRSRSRKDTGPLNADSHPQSMRSEHARQEARRQATVTVASYRDDPLYPRIERAVTAILAKGNVVTPIDVLLKMKLLAPARLDDWRRYEPYLEKVIGLNLTGLSRLLRILRFHAT